jgi:solute carrier family 25, member 39/40
MDHIGEFQQCKTCSGETQPVYRSTIDTALKIIKLEGVQSLWRGILPSLMMQLPSTVFYYTLYDKIKLEFQKNLENENELIFLYSGMIARTITTSITSPFDFLKTSIQSSNKSTKSREIISSIIKQHGIKFLIHFLKLLDLFGEELYQLY